MTLKTLPATLADDLRHLTAVELSLPSRLRYVALLLAAATMTAIVTALLITEPMLPLRTSLALGMLAVMGVSWMTFAAWVLTRKHVLLAGHRIVAGRLAVIFTSVFVTGALFVGLTRSRASAFAAAAMGGVMLAVAVTIWIRAKRQFARLSKRRDELQRRLEGEELS
jgi:membrane associated rhomboid family serine protease